MKNFFIKIFKEIIATIILFSGIPTLIRFFIAKKKVTIALYHNPTVQTFEEHLIYLKKKYNLIELKDLTYSIYNNTWTNIP